MLIAYFTIIEMEFSILELSRDRVDSRSFRLFFYLNKLSRKNQRLDRPLVFCLHSEILVLRLCKQNTRTLNFPKQYYSFSSNKCGVNSIWQRFDFPDQQAGLSTPDLNNLLDDLQYDEGYGAAPEEDMADDYAMDMEPQVYSLQRMLRLAIL